MPQRFEFNFPKQAVFGGKRILIDHAFPFAPTRSNISRPPVEESMHDHWKNTASLAPAQKKNRSNCIAHLEDCFPSLQRMNMLQEISIRSRGITGSFEASSTPLLFFNGVPELADGLQTFVSIARNIPDIATDVDHSIERYFDQPSSMSDVSSHSVILYVLSVHCTDHVPLNIGRILTRRNGCIVSTTELLRCHAFTECLLFAMLPKGIRIEGFCTPKRHFKVVLRIPVRSPKDRPIEVLESPLTSLGENPTQHLDQGTARDDGKSPSGDEDSPVEPASCLPQGLATAVSPSAPDVSTSLKRKGTKAPQPVAVDGCGDKPLLNDDGGKLASLEEADVSGKFSPRKSALPDPPDTKSLERLPQPVAVGGCGGPPPPTGIDQGDSPRVTTTVAWTEPLVLPSQETPSQTKKELPHHTRRVGTVMSLVQQGAEDMSRKDNVEDPT